MGKLLVYAGLGIGAILSLVLVAMLLRGPESRAINGSGQTTSLSESDSSAAAEAREQGSADAGGETDSTAAGFSAETKRQLEGLGFRVFDNPPQAEDFLLQSIDQGELRLSSFKGKVVLMNFWATWCPPCIEEMPSMQRLYHELPRDSFEILAINMQEDRGTVQQFISEHSFEYPILLDFGGEVAQRYAVRGLPTSYVIAPDGSMPAALIGFAHWDEPGFVEFFQNLTSAPHASR